MLWVDAVCIDQSDVEEKSHQVALMPEIYFTATKVLCWLGTSTPETTLAIQQFKELAMNSIEQMM